MFLQTEKPGSCPKSLVWYFWSSPQAVKLAEGPRVPWRRTTPVPSSWTASPWTLHKSLSPELLMTFDKPSPCKAFRCLISSFLRIIKNTLCLFFHWCRSWGFALYSSNLACNCCQSLSFLSRISIVSEV